MIKAYFLILILGLVACSFNPVAYEEQREQEHEDHLKQNGI